MKDDTISRQEAIDALWKAMYEFEDKTEKQFQESDELDAEDWIQHRIFVQNMSDIDRKTIMDLPSAQPEPYEEDEELDFVQEHKKLPIILETRGKAHWIEVGREEGALGIQYKRLRCSKCGWESSLPIPRKFCPECGSYNGGEQTNV